MRARLGRLSSCGRQLTTQDAREWRTRWRSLLVTRSCVVTSLVGRTSPSVWCKRSYSRRTDFPLAAPFYHNVESMTVWFSGYAKVPGVDECHVGAKKTYCFHLQPEGSRTGCHVKVPPNFRLSFRHFTSAGEPRIGIVCIERGLGMAVTALPCLCVGGKLRSNRGFLRGGRTLSRSQLSK